MAEKRKATERPWFPFYPADWLSDEKVQALSLEAKGLYIETLCILWKTRTCRMKYDPGRLARLFKLDQAKFEQIWVDEIQHVDGKLFKTDSKGFFWSERLCAELNKIIMVKKQKIKAAKARWGKESQARALHMECHPHPHPHPHTDNTDNNRAKGPAAYYQKLAEQQVTQIDQKCTEIINLVGKNNGFNPFQMVQAAVNENRHPEAIMDALDALITYWGSVKNKWTYGMSVIKTKSQNYYEQEHIQQAEAFKVEFNYAAQLGELSMDKILKEV